MSDLPKETVERVKSRRYECFVEDREPEHWSPGRCAGYAGIGSLALLLLHRKRRDGYAGIGSQALHPFRCKRRDGHGLGGLFCWQHAKDSP